ncbi:MAG: PepSY domain-containing protein [Clostridia bacterium]
MMRRFGVTFLGVMLFAAIIGLVPQMTDRTEKVVRIEDMKKEVESRFAGAVTSIALANEGGAKVYRSTLQRDSGTYQVKTDPHSGQVLQITPLTINPPVQAKPPNEALPAERPMPASDEKSSGLSTTGISLDRAREIALAQVKGTFTGIEVEKVNGSRVYQVEIDSPGEQEATVQVDAFTGKVLSVLWED